MRFGEIISFVIQFVVSNASDGVLLSLRGKERGPRIGPFNAALFVCTSFCFDRVNALRKDDKIGIPENNVVYLRCHEVVLCGEFLGTSRIVDY